MTASDLRAHLAAYAAGLESEVAALRQIVRLAGEQCDAATGPDADRLAALAADRDRLMAELDEIESRIRPSRTAVAEHRRTASVLSGFEHAQDLHRTAGALVTRILEADEATQEALRASERERHAATQALDAGESTLAAYRRVLSSGGSGPSLVDRRG